MKVILRVLIGAASLLIAASFIPGIVVEGAYSALIAAVILGILNLVVRPVLILLTLPITLITLGLFFFIINASLFWFAASFIEGFSVAGFVPALLGSLLTSLLSTLGNKLLT